ncbi:MAG: lysylphosphatidylglycerol synthase domain-containing protein [Flavisolibacter sp.]
MHIKQSFYSYKFTYLLVAFALIFLNWGLEAFKWRISLASVYTIGWWQAFKAVLSGVSFSVSMPNRVGEYFGRMMYMPEGNRLKIISISLVGSFAQLLITVLFGIIGLLLLKNLLINEISGILIWYRFIIYGLTTTCFLMMVVYFNIAGSVEQLKRWFKNERFAYLVDGLHNFKLRLLIRLLMISFMRYIVFIIQYALIFSLFDVHLPLLVILETMSVIFLTLALIPSIALIEVGLRGEISIKLIGLFTTNTLGIGLTSVTVWFINLILPAIIGSFFILNMKVFNRKNETF